MAEVLFAGNKVKTAGNLPETGSAAPDFKLVKTDLSDASLADYKGKKVILNIFPSLDTPVCATSIRKFNQEASSLDNTVVLCISKDTPFAHKKFCTTEGLENVVSLSEFRYNEFGSSYGVTFEEGPFKGLFSRSIVVIDENGKVVHTEQVPNTGDEPNYEKALAAVK